MPSVLFVAEGGDSSCAYYRAHLPVKGMEGHGWQAKVAAAVYPSDDGYLIWGNPPTDVVVLRRLTDTHGDPMPFADEIRAARDMGQLVYMDLDDDPWNLPEWNPASGTEMDRNLPSWVADMEACTGVIVSTPALQESVLANTRQRNVILCRNGVDPTVFNPPTVEREIVRVAVCGLIDFRGPDIATIREPLWRFFSDTWNRDTVELWHLGKRPGHGAILDVIGADFLGNVTEVPWVPIWQWPEALAAVDVVLIPQVRNAFSEARSAATGLACAAAGVPFVASPTGEYVRLWMHGVGYVTDTGWEDALAVMTRPEYLRTRQEMRTAGLLYARTVVSPLQTASQYVEAFEKDAANA